MLVRYASLTVSEIVEWLKRGGIVIGVNYIVDDLPLELLESPPVFCEIQRLWLTRERGPCLNNDEMVDHLAKQIRALKLHHTLPNELPSLIEGAYQRFALFHRERAVIERGDHIVLNSKLAQYYGNRLAHIPLTPLGE